MKIRNFLITLFIATFSIPTLADIAIVVHPNNPLANLTKEDAAKIFLSKTKTFPNGKEVSIIDLEEGDEIRNAFYEKVTNKSASQVKAYWSRLIFTGKGQPPKVAIDSDEVISAISNNENAIGYIDTDDINENVKVIFKVP